SAGFWQRLSACTIEIASRRYQVPQYMGVLEAVGGSAANQMRELLSVLCSICARVLVAAEFPDCNMSQSEIGRASCREVMTNLTETVRVTAQNIDVSTEQ